MISERVKNLRISEKDRQYSVRAELQRKAEISGKAKDAINKLMYDFLKVGEGNIQTKQEICAKILDHLRIIPKEERTRFLSAMTEIFGFELTDKQLSVAQRERALAEWTNMLIEMSIKQEPGLDVLNPFLKSPDLLMPILIAAQKQMWKGFLGRLITEGNVSPDVRATAIMAQLKGALTQEVVEKDIYFSIGKYCRTKDEMEKVVITLFKELLKEKLNEEQQKALQHLSVGERFMSFLLPDHFPHAPRE